MLIKVLQGNYEYGWDDLLEFSTASKQERIEMLRTYQQNEKGALHRIITRRVKKDS